LDDPSRAVIDREERAVRMRLCVSCRIEVVVGGGVGGVGVGVGVGV